MYLFRDFNFIRLDKVAMPNNRIVLLATGKDSDGDRCYGFFDGGMENGLPVWTPGAYLGCTYQATEKKNRLADLERVYRTMTREGYENSLRKYSGGYLSKVTRKGTIRCLLEEEVVK